MRRRGVSGLRDRFPNDSCLLSLAERPQAELDRR